MQRSFSPVVQLECGLTRLTREAYRREIVPERILWWLAAAGIRDWSATSASRPAPAYAGQMKRAFGIADQPGIVSVFGLRHHLSKTIPNHGGHTCRIDVKPIQLGRGRDGVTT